MKKMIFKIMGTIILMSLLCCVDGREFDDIEGNCTTDMVANITFEELDSLVQDDVIQIHEDLILEGYVISSDRAGNIFGVLYIQDKLNNPSMGIQLEMDLRESHLQFPVGSKVLVKLKNLYLGKRGTNIRIGSVFSSFGNLSIGRLPSGKVFEHLFISCEGTLNINVSKVGVASLSNGLRKNFFSIFSFNKSYLSLLSETIFFSLINCTFPMAPCNSVIL